MSRKAAMSWAFDGKKNEKKKQLFDNHYPIKSVPVVYKKLKCQFEKVCFVFVSPSGKICPIPPFNLFCASPTSYFVLFPDSLFDLATPDKTEISKKMEYN